MSLGCLASNCDVRSYPQKLWRFARQFFYTKAHFPKAFKHFISVSNFSQKLLAPHLPKESFFWSVPNPIDIPKLPPASPQNHQAFSYIGRLSAEKGVALLSDLDNISLRFIGQGEEEIKLKKQHLHAHFTGWVNDQQLADLVGNAIATIYLPINEDFGISPVESMAAGKPVIGVAEGGLLETVIDKQTGILISAVDHLRIIEAVSDLSSKQAQTMRHDCEQQAQQFSKERFLQQMGAQIQC
jgi:glycosyltransferase involved in cell wall biosynthesis